MTILFWTLDKNSLYPPVGLWTKAGTFHNAKYQILKKFLNKQIGYVCWDIFVQSPNLDDNV